MGDFEVDGGGSQELGGNGGAHGDEIGWVGRVHVGRQHFAHCVEGRLNA